MSIKKHELVLAALGLILTGVIIICAAFDTPELKAEEKSDYDVVVINQETQTEVIVDKFLPDGEYSTDLTETQFNESNLKININTASAEELTALNNIGAQRAADIIAYREQYNGFDTVEELTNIYGIGETTLEQIRDYITVE
ncbi:MAG: helix-hairpin-helix domain-containing protein [Clostridia bacterium]|nr:helix-hairpin-helix domain-containing protein [Clostridia bacterium]